MCKKSSQNNNELPSDSLTDCSADCPSSRSVESAQRLILDSLEDAVLVADSDLRILYANDVMRRWFDLGDAAGRDDTVRDEQLAVILGTLIAAVDAGQAPQPVRLQAQPKNSQSLNVEVSVKKLTQNNRLNGCYLFLIKDVSRLVVAERNRVKCEQDLALASKISAMFGSPGAFAVILSELKLALGTLDGPTGGRILVYESSHDLLWQAMAWGIAENTVFEPIQVSDYNRKYFVSDPKAVGTHAQAAQRTSKVAGLMPWCIPIVAGNHMQAIMELYGIDPKGLSEQRQEFFSLLSHLIGHIMRNSVLYEEALASRKRLRWLRSSTVSAVEAERKNIARELHDEVGQLLLVLRLALGAGPEAQTASQQTDYANHQSILSELSAKVRGMITDMRPSVLLEHGLVSGIDWLIERLGKVTATKLSFKYSNLQDVRFDGDVEIIFFRIVQEALSNIIKYADADSAQISLSYVDGVLLLNVVDNGVGFDVYSEEASAECYGIVGMRERIDAVSGVLNIESSASEGTKLTATVTARALP